MLARREGLGSEAPFGVGSAPPHAGTGAGCIHEDAVHAAGEIAQCTGCGRTHLDISCPGPPKSFVYWREPHAVGIVGVDLAVVRHESRERQGLPAAACAGVEHLASLLWSHEQSGDLAAFVLHLYAA